MFYKTATGKSPYTIADYRVSLNKLLLYFDNNPPFASITREQLVGFFVWLQDDYISTLGGAARREPLRLAPKTIKNIHTALSALWISGLRPISRISRLGAAARAVKSTVT